MSVSAAGVQLATGSQFTPLLAISAPRTFSSANEIGSGISDEVKRRSFLGGGGGLKSTAVLSVIAAGDRRYTYSNPVRTPPGVP